MRTNTRPLTLLATCALIAACGGTEDSAVIVGSLDTGMSRSELTSGESSHSARASLQIEVNGENRTVDVGADGSFVVGELTQGNLSFSLTWNGIKGTIEIEDVQPSEVIDLRVRLRSGRLSLEIKRRAAPTNDETLLPTSGNIEITGKDHVVRLTAGTYHGNITIRGDGITLIGPPGDPCNVEESAIVRGRIVVKGRDVRVLRVDARGGFEIRGKGSHLILPVCLL